MIAQLKSKRRYALTETAADQFADVSKMMVSVEETAAMMEG